MATNENRWYRSKVDWWLMPILGIPPLASIAVIAQAATEGSAFGVIAGCGIAMFVAGIYFGLVWPMSYGLGKSELIVRSGLYRRRIPLTAISEVSPTRNPLSSPALSLDRLNVRFGEGMFRRVMISPAERDRFLDDLADLAGLTRDGDRLRRP